MTIPTDLMNKAECIWACINNQRADGKVVDPVAAIAEGLMEERARCFREALDFAEAGDAAEERAPDTIRKVLSSTQAAICRHVADAIIRPEQFRAQSGDPSNETTVYSARFAMSDIAIQLLILQRKDPKKYEDYMASLKKVGPK